MRGLKKILGITSHPNSINKIVTDYVNSKYDKKIGEKNSTTQKTIERYFKKSNS